MAIDCSFLHAPVTASGMDRKSYTEEARAADKLDAKLKLEAHWLEHGVAARRKHSGPPPVHVPRLIATKPARPRSILPHSPIRQRSRLLFIALSESSDESN